MFSHYSSWINLGVLSFYALVLTTTVDYYFVLALSKYKVLIMCLREDSHICSILTFKTLSLGWPNGSADISTCLGRVQPPGLSPWHGVPCYASPTHGAFCDSNWDWAWQHVPVILALWEAQGKSITMSLVCVVRPCIHCRPFPRYRKKRKKITFSLIVPVKISNFFKRSLLLDAFVYTHAFKICLLDRRINRVVEPWPSIHGTPRSHP